MAEPEPGSIFLARLDRIIAELVELRAEVGASQPPAEGNGLDRDEASDLSPDNLLDTTAAAARFNHPQDTIRAWCRQGDGIRQGGRWLVSIPKLQRRLNGG